MLALARSAADVRADWGPWGSVWAVLVWPGRTLATVAERRYLWVPYLLAVALSLAGVLFMPRPDGPVSGPAALASAGDRPAAGAPMAPAQRSLVPMPPGSPQPLSGNELWRAVQPMAANAAAVTVPVWSGLWRTAVLLVIAGLGGQVLGFRRTLGVVGYTLVPLWLGEALRAGMVLVSGDAAATSKIRWTLDVLWPAATGSWAKVLSAVDVFQVWHLVLLVVACALLTQRRPWQVAWVGLLVFALPPLIQSALPYLNRWFGSGGTGAGDVLGPGGPAGPGAVGGPVGPMGPGAPVTVTVPAGVSKPVIVLPAPPMR